jgi:hypothetical protein
LWERKDFAKTGVDHLTKILLLKEFLTAHQSPFLHSSEEKGQWQKRKAQI